VLGEEPRVVDSEYTVPGRETENQLPMAFAATFGAKIAHSHLALEGGNLLSNGQGVCISSSTIIDQNLPRGHDLQAIGRRLNSTFGFTRWVYLKPLIGESTGHVDLFLTVGGTNKVILASYDPDQDRANAELMNENARLLADGLGGDGQTLEIIRIRQPTARDGRWLSYTNVIYANGVVLVPQYPDTCPDLDRQALDVYRRAFPDRRIVGIDTSKIATKRGGLHCLSLAIPRLHDPTGQSVASR
jgi:agmatine deiminase